MEFWRQCTLQKDNAHTVVWIPEWAAKVGVAIKSSENQELNGWTVTTVSVTRITEDAARTTDRMYKKFKESGSLAKQKCA